MKIKQTGTMLFVKCGVFAEAHELDVEVIRSLKSGVEVTLSDDKAKKYIDMKIAVEVENSETVEAPVDTNNDTESPGSESVE